LLRKYAGGTDADFGREETVQAYIDHTMLALRESWRVLRNDGILFWNICDSYYGSGRGSGSKLNPRCSTTPTRGLSRAKSLCLIPERVAIAAQAAGWIIRDQIIWYKPNSVPEFVQDRCTRSYEVICMLTKQQNYFWNKEEAREASRTSPHAVGTGPKGDKLIDSGIHGKRTDSPISAKHQVLAGRKAVGKRIPSRDARPLRDVWTINTRPHSEAHPAMWPEALVERMIRISTRAGDTVLDQFAGSGTTGLVAKRLGRNSILLDTSEEYCHLMRSRVVTEDGISADDERLEGMAG